MFVDADRLRGVGQALAAGPIEVCSSEVCASEMLTSPRVVAAAGGLHVLGGENRQCEHHKRGGRGDDSAKVRVHG